MPPTLLALLQLGFTSLFPLSLQLLIGCVTLLLSFEDRVLSGLGCPGTRYVEQAGLELAEILQSCVCGSPLRYCLSYS